MGIASQIVVLVLALMGVTAFEEWLWMLTAVARRLTVRELRSIWTFKHCFAIQSTDEEDGGASHFVHRSYSLLALVRNVITFLLR